MENSDTKLPVFNVERFAVHDGPGIRTNVFLKGCPLHCAWCANPESQSLVPQLMHLTSKCTGCETCVSACPTHSITMVDHKAVINRAACVTCGNCVKACPNSVNKISGKETSLQEIYDEVMKDKAYYDASHGGVTFSGGEALVHAQQLVSLLKQLKEDGIDIAFETCGHVGQKQFETVLPYVDHFLFDFKANDPAIFHQYTGGDLSVILNNLQYVASKDPSKITIRIPVIPYVNYDENTLHTMLAYVKERGIVRVDLLPYHTLGITKYDQLGIAYPFPSRESLKSDALISYCEYGESIGLNITIGG